MSAQIPSLKDNKFIALLGLSFLVIALVVSTQLVGQTQLFQSQASCTCTKDGKTYQPWAYVCNSSGNVSVCAARSGQCYWQQVKTCQYGCNDGVCRTSELPCLSGLVPPGSSICVYTDPNNVHVCVNGEIKIYPCPTGYVCPSSGTSCQPKLTPVPPQKTTPTPTPTPTVCAAPGPAVKNINNELINGACIDGAKPHLFAFRTTGPDNACYPQDTYFQIKKSGSEVMSSGWLIGQITKPSGFGSWTAFLPKEGSYTWQVRARNAAGLNPYDNNLYRFSIDATPPVVVDAGASYGLLGGDKKSFMVHWGVAQMTGCAGLSPAGAFSIKIYENDSLCSSADLPSDQRTYFTGPPECPILFNHKIKWVIVAKDILGRFSKEVSGIQEINF